MIIKPFNYPDDLHIRVTLEQFEQTKTHPHGLIVFKYESEQ